MYDRHAQRSDRAELGSQNHFPDQEHVEVGTIAIEAISVAIAKKARKVQVSRD